MNEKKANRVHRGKRTRLNIRESGKASLVVNKTPRHIYAQIISGEGDRVLASASTLQEEIRSTVRSTGNIEAASKVGTAIADQAKSLGVNEIAFDRNGFRFHGRIRALAEAARKAGLKF